MKKLNTSEFIRKAHEVHGDKYDYSKVKYVNSHTPITIICPVHGEFQQLPYCHLQGNGCSACNGGDRFKDRLTTEEFIQKAKEVHGNKYDYSKVNYVNAHTPITIICPVHGEFQQEPCDHLLFLPGRTSATFL